MINEYSERKRNSTKEKESVCISNFFFLFFSFFLPFFSFIPRKRENKKLHLIRERNARARLVPLHGIERPILYRINVSIYNI